MHVIFYPYILVLHWKPFSGNYVPSNNNVYQAISTRTNISYSTYSAKPLINSQINQVQIVIFKSIMLWLFLCFQLGLSIDRVDYISIPVYQKIYMNLPPMNQTYFWEINFISLFRWGITSSEIDQNGPFLLTKFRKFYRWYIFAAINSHFLDPLSRVWSKHFWLQHLCKILCLMVWDNTYFAWQWSVISLKAGRTFILDLCPPAAG